MKHESSGIEYVATVQYTPSSDTHIITYKGNFKKYLLLKKTVPVVVSFLGKKGVLKAGDLLPRLVLFLTVLASVLLYLHLSAEYNVDYWDFLLLFAIMGFFFFSVGVGFSCVANYYLKDLCEVCAREFAYEEFEKPDIEEISTSEDYSLKITRHWKCKYCGNEKLITGSEGFVTTKGEKMGFSLLVKIPCKNCGKTTAYEEYKKPDVKKIMVNANNVITTTMRYYRCKYCGYEDLEAEEVQEISGEDDYSRSVQKITYEDC